MSLMHDALKEMDKPRRDSSTAGIGLGGAAAVAPMSAKSLDDADAYEESGENNLSGGETSGFNVTLIAWILGITLCAVLAALWWVQSRQSQQAQPATEPIAALPAPPKLAAQVLPQAPPQLAAEVALPTVMPVLDAPLVPAPAVAITVAATPPIPATAPMPTKFAVADTIASTPSLVAPVAATPMAAKPAEVVVPAPAKLTVAAVPVAPIKPRTAVISTTTLPAPVVVPSDTAASAMPDATIESRLANAGLAANPAANANAVALLDDAPKPPVLSAKQMAAKNAASAAESKRKEAEAEQTANARAATSKNAAIRYAAIGRELEAGNRAAAQVELSSLEQELPASSLTLLRARAWVAGSGADMAAARSAYAAILSRLPEDENALLNMAALEAKDGKMDAARNFLAQALSANPESAAAKAAQQRIAALTAQPR